MNKFLFLFFGLFFLSSVSAYTYEQLGTFQLPLDYSYFDIDLSCSEDFGFAPGTLDDYVYVAYVDQNNSNILYFTWGYATINYWYYDFGMTINDGHYILRYETYDNPYENWQISSEIFICDNQFSGSRSSSAGLINPASYDSFFSDCHTAINYSVQGLTALSQPNPSEESYPACVGGGGSSGSLLAYYKLDESSGTSVYDETGNYNGTLSGSHVHINQPAKINTGYYGDDASDSSKVSLPFDLMSYSDFSISLWGNWTTTDSVTSLVGMKMSGSEAVSAETLTDVNNGSKNHIVVTRDGTNYSIYLNGVYQASDTGSANGCSIWANYPTSNRVGIRCQGSSTGTATTNLFQWTSASAQVAKVTLDEVGFWNSTLNSSYISFLYNGGSGNYPSELNESVGGSNESNPAPILNYSIPDVYIGAYENYSLNLDYYFDGWDDVKIVAPDPWTNFTYNIWTGYSTLNTEFYEVYVFANGTAILQAYDDNYQASFQAVACSGQYLDNCTNDTFIFNVSSNVTSDVISLRPFSNIELGFSGCQSFSINTYFSNYDDFVFIFPDSNYSGVLNSSFPYFFDNYTGTCGGQWVYLNCSRFDSTNYNFLGDLNITLVCGSDVDLDICAYSEYEQNVYVYAYNTEGNYSNDFFHISSGNPVAYSCPDDFLAVFNSSSGANYSASNFYNSTSDFFPNIDDVDYSVIKSLMINLVVLLSVVVFLGSFGFTRNLGFSVLLVFISNVFLLFFFAYKSYIQFTTPIGLLALVLLSVIIKFWRGGGSNG